MSNVATPSHTHSGLPLSLPTPLSVCPVEVLLTGCGYGYCCCPWPLAIITHNGSQVEICFKLTNWPQEPLNKLEKLVFHCCGCSLIVVAPVVPVVVVVAPVVVGVTVEHWLFIAPVISDDRNEFFLAAAASSSSSSSSLMCIIFAKCFCCYLLLLLLPLRRLH